MVKPWLHEHKVPFELRDVRQPEAAREFLALGLGPVLPPVVVVDGVAVTHFDPARLEQLIFGE